MASTSTAPLWSVQPQTEATSAGAEPAVAVKDVCTDLEDAGGLGTRSGLKVHLQQRFEPLRVIGSQRKKQLDEQRDGCQRFKRHRFDATAVSVPRSSPDSVACPTRTARSLIVIRQSLAVRVGW